MKSGGCRDKKIYLEDWLTTVKYYGEKLLLRSLKKGEIRNARKLHEPGANAKSYEVNVKNPRRFSSQFARKTTGETRTKSLLFKFAKNFPHITKRRYGNAS